MTPPCSILQWDSAFFRKQIARVNASALPDHMWPTIQQWCTRNKIDCLYLLINFDDIESIRTAEQHGFRLADARMTFELREPHGSLITGTRVAKENDIDALQDIAGAAFTQTRFSRDPVFRSQAEQFYRTWIANDIRGRAHQVIVAHDNDDSPTGFISCYLPQRASGEIGLTAVQTANQNQGIGSKLVRAALAWFGNVHAERVLVATNGGNLQAQRLYQSSGFKSYSTQLWYHQWFSAR